MCGRFALTMPHAAMAQAFAAVPSNDLPDGPRWNVCPTTQIPAVLSADGTRRIVSMRWGFLPRWYDTPSGGPLLINARAETVAEKPAFRDAVRSRRCLIPATGFYEWEKDAEGTRLPWYFHPADAEFIAFAGIWQGWGPDDAPTCAIVSCAAGPSLREIHHREPVTLAAEDWPLWLGEAGHGAAPLMRAAPEGRLRRYRVSRAVNSNRAEGEELIEPLIDEDDA